MPDRPEVERLLAIGNALMKRAAQEHDQSLTDQANAWLDLATATASGLDKTHDFFRL